MRIKFLVLSMLFLMVLNTGCGNNTCSNDNVFINPALVDQKQALLQMTMRFKTLLIPNLTNNLYFLN